MYPGGGKRVRPFPAAGSRSSSMACRHRLTEMTLIPSHPIQYMRHMRWEGCRIMGESMDTSQKIFMKPTSRRRLVARSPSFQDVCPAVFAHFSHPSELITPSTV